MAEVALNTIQLGNSGHPLLMLHGWGQDLQSLKPMGELLAEIAQVEVFDLPGFGKSALPDGDWDTMQYADRILAHMDERGWEKVDLLGHSFGGRVSIRLANKYPQRVRKIILINSGGLKRRLTFAQKLRSQWIKAQRNAFKLMPVKRQELLDWHSNKYGSRDYLNAGALKGTFLKAVNEDVTEIVKNIKAPTLLLWGEKDTETPVEMGYRYHNLFPNSQLITIPRGDHFMFQGEGAHLCAYYVKKFLTE